jgi:hypothetical protein
VSNAGQLEPLADQLFDRDLDQVLELGGLSQ